MSLSDLSPSAIVNDKGWDCFTLFCELITTAIPLEARKVIAEPPTNYIDKPPVLFSFERALEAMVRASNNLELWANLIRPLDEARQIIVFREPGPKHAPRGCINVEDISSRTVFQLFARCLACAIAKSRAIPPNTTILSAEYARCKRAWESDYVEYDVIAPIIGIASDFDGHPDLYRGLGLADTCQGSSPYRKHHLQTHGVPMWRSLPRYAITGRRSIAKGDDIENAMNESFSDAVRLVTALRLMTGHDIGCDVMHLLPSESHYQTSNLLCNHSRSTAMISILGDWDYSGAPVPQSDLKASAEMANLLEGKPGQAIAIALERFNWAIGRLNPEEQIIDLAIALESTLCRGDGNAQLSYRFRMLGAAVLSNVPGADDAFVILKGLYAARSKIVHVGMRYDQLATSDELRPLFKDRPPLAFLADCRRIARLVVIEFLRQAALGRMPAEYIKAMEVAMINQAKAFVERHDA